MKCGKPFRKDGVEYGCGQCLPCRFNRRRQWTMRLVLESTQHEFSSFVTLTYDKEHVPHDGSVSVREMQLFLKRLRMRACGSAIRFFGVGEYGDQSWRPHYHLCLFGVSDRSAICDSWQRGYVDVGSLTFESAAYVAGYSVKRMTDARDERLGGRAPEFARMSLRPGIGAGAVGSISEGVTSRAGARFVAGVGDVPGVLRFGGKTWPIGRYLKEKLRESLGMDKGCPDAVLAMAARRVWDSYVESGLSSKAFVELEAGKRLQSVLRAEARAQIQRVKKGL